METIAVKFSAPSNFSIAGITLLSLATRLLQIVCLAQIAMLSTILKIASKVDRIHCMIKKCVYDLHANQLENLQRL